jgi:perosamine synthetase
MSEPYLGKGELKNVTEAVKSGWISSSGKFIPEFESAFSKYIRTKHGIATSNGTTAIHLALAALGIKKGDNVILPSLTSISCANAIRSTCAKPVFADITRAYWCIDPEDIRKKISNETKAIMAVHIYGHPCDMDAIMEIANDNQIPVIEDCAEAHGAEYKERRVGSFGAISCFSFYGNKIITTGEGGMCMTDDDALADQMRILRNQGTRPQYKNKYYYDVVGFNYRLTNIQAGIGLAQLSKINYLIEQKRRIAGEYNKWFRSTKSIVTAPEMPWAMNVYWYYSILVKKNIRDDVIRVLADNGIESRPFFYPIHMLPIYKQRIRLDVTEMLGFSGINLPSGPKLKAIDIERISKIILSVAK